MRAEKMLYRNELKYYINQAVYEQMRRNLQAGIKADANSQEGKGYSISSVYYDDMYLSAYRDKMAGLLNRQKYRIRAYNRDPKIIKFEKKMKTGDLIKKTSFPIDYDEYMKIQSGDYAHMIHSKYQLAREFFVESRTKRIVPRAIVEYDREAFIMESGNVRITFDKDLRVDITTKDMFSSHSNMKRIFDRPVIIMEVKFDEFLPSIGRNLVQNLNNEYCAISKYTKCMDTMASLRGFELGIGE